MLASQTLKARIEQGKSLRKKTPRKGHTQIGEVQRDPISLVEASNRGRVDTLIPLRHGRMLESPFAFFRGTATIQAHDLSTTPTSGLIHQICGDSHLLNFGGFATPERDLIFDLNDFDETYPGPWEWDVKRFAASLVLACSDFGFKGGTADEVVWMAVRSYQQNMADYAQMGALEVWYDRVSYTRELDQIDDQDIHDLVERRMQKAQGRTHASLLEKICYRVGDQWLMNDTAPELFHIHGSCSLFSPEDDWMQFENWHILADKIFKEYLTTLAPSHQQLLGRFMQQDLAFKVVGVGSVGTRCLILLMTDVAGQPLFLQIKEAGRSALADYLPKPKVKTKHEGYRVVQGQRLIQAASDAFLGWSTGPSGRHFYLRQLRDMKISADLRLYDEKMLGFYAQTCGRVLARAHARAGGLAPEIAGYLGKSEQFADVLVPYAQTYAKQVEKDYDSFREACRSGRLMAQSEADFAADLKL